ncbi:MAG TPA: flippase [Drouetiella sp.]|jgi:O-antigen/teichoic acid export membrane protein
MSKEKPGISKNFAILSVGQMISRVLAFAVTIQMTRVLLPDEYGAVVFAMTVLAYVGIVVDFGFDAWGPLEVARGITPVPTIVKSVLSLRLLMLMPALVGLAIATYFMPLPPLTKTIILISGATMIPSALDLNWVFLGSKSMVPAIVSDCLCQLLMASGVFLLVKHPDDVMYVPIMQVATRAVAVGYLMVTYTRTFGRLNLGWEGETVRKFVTGSLPLVGSALVGRIIENFDILLLGIWVGSEATGLYGASFRVVWMLVLITVAYYTALRPTLAQAYVQGFHTIEALLNRVMRISAAIAVGASVGGILVAEPLVDFLYGKAYLPAVPALQVLLALFGLHMLSRTYRVTLISFNKQGNDLRIMSLAALVNVVLNFLVIKKYGIMGAALANFACEFLILVLDYFAAQKFVGRIPLGRHLWKPAIAACFMYPIVQATHHLHLLVQIALAGGAYVGLVFLFRAITMDDVKAILNRQKKTADEKIETLAAQAEALAQETDAGGPEANLNPPCVAGK